jgi:hypothetical protein
VEAALAVFFFAEEVLITGGDEEGERKEKGT